MRFSVCLLALCSLFFAHGAAVAASEEKLPSLRLESVEILPAKPAPDTLCKLRIKIRNSGTQTASRLALNVRINGERIPGYDNLLLFQPLAPGATTDVPLYNFWSTETSRPRPKDGKLAVEVEIRKAEWMKLEKDQSGAEVWTPAGEVPGLPGPPISRSVSLAMGGKP